MPVLQENVAIRLAVLGCGPQTPVVGPSSLYRQLCLMNEYVGIFWKVLITGFL
jgi:hypothetical protein